MKDFRSAKVAFVGLAFTLLAQGAHATLIVSVSEVGSDVVLTQTGSLDFSGGSIEDFDQVQFHRQIAGTAPGTTAFNSFTTLSRFVRFFGEATPDAGAFTVGNTQNISGSIADTAGLLTLSGDLFVYMPRSSSSGSAISTGYTILSQSFASLGLTDGQTAMWNLANGDSVTWTVGPQAVPEPSTLALLGLGIAGLGFARRRRKH